MTVSDPRQHASLAVAEGSPAGPAGATWLNGHAWRDGDVPPAAAVVIHDRGFLLGDGLFETVAICAGRPILWKPHIERMRATGEALHFPLPARLEDDALLAVEILLDLVDPPVRQRGTLRITVTRGSGTAYGLDAPAQVKPNMLLRITPTNRRSREPGRRETAWIVDQPRIDPSNLLSGHKTTSSMWRVVAHETARKHGADLALLRTIDGDLGEADTASLFAVIEETVVTPPLSRGILPSTTRAFALAELEEAGRSSEERQLLPKELEGASEVFISSSVTGIRALGAVNGRALPEAAPVADWLDERYEALEG